MDRSGTANEYDLRHEVASNSVVTSTDWHTNALQGAGGSGGAGLGGVSTGGAAAGGASASGISSSTPTSLPSGGNGTSNRVFTSPGTLQTTNSTFVPSGIGITPGSASTNTFGSPR